MDSEQQEACRDASQNAIGLEEMLLTVGHTFDIDIYKAERVVERCETIIRCMQILFPEENL